MLTPDLSGGRPYTCTSLYTLAPGDNTPILTPGRMVHQVYLKPAIILHFPRTSWQRAQPQVLSKSPSKQPGISQRHHLLRHCYLPAPEVAPKTRCYSLATITRVLWCRSQPSPRTFSKYMPLGKVDKSRVRPGVLPCCCSTCRPCKS